MSIFDGLSNGEQEELLDLIEHVTRSAYIKIAGCRGYTLSSELVERMTELHNKIRPPYELQGGKKIRTTPKK